MDKTEELLVLGWPEWICIQDIQELNTGILAVGVALLFMIMFISCCQKKINKNIPDHIRKEMQDTVADLKETVQDIMAPRSKQRFRKRDKVYFYGRKMMRKSGEVIKLMEDVGQRNKAEGRKLIRSLAKTLIGDSSDSSTQGDLGLEGRPAEDYLEEEEELQNSRVPPELKYLLNSFHMFGEFEPAVFSELYPDIETVRVPAGQYLFRIGEPDVYIFVVQSGRIDVTTSDETGTHEIKRVGPGETLSSLLSFIDILTGNVTTYKTVEARAGVDSLVLRLSTESFFKVFDKNPEILIRVVQMIMARCQRVVFVGLHQYLGLSSQLIRDREENFNHSSDVEEDEHNDSGFYGLRNDKLLLLGVAGLQQELNLDDDVFLRDVVQIRRVEKGEKIMTESNYSDAALIYIIDGEVGMYLKNLDNGSQDELYTAKTGECAGQLAILTGEANFYTCQALKSTLIAYLPKKSFFSIVSATPEMVLSLAHSTCKRLSPLVRKIDFALDWITLEGGGKVKPPVYQPDSTYLVLSGRLRGYAYRNHVKQLVGEYGRGDMVGIVDNITGTRRTTSYMAIRDSEICIVPPQILDFLKTRYTVVTNKLISILGRRLNRSNDFGETSYKGPVEESRFQYNSIAVYPATSDVPITAFCLELERSLNVIGPSTRLSSQTVVKRFGQDPFQGRYEYRINSWLNQQEDIHNCIVYQCDMYATAWTRKCFRHADIVLIVTNTNNSSLITEAEIAIEEITKRIRKELVLLWPPETAWPKNTADWLKRRPWLSGHIHIKMNHWMHQMKSDLSYNQIVRHFTKYSSAEVDIHSDYSRLARHVQGKSIGLVLGGGGARGAAHVGMLRALLEAEIPIDKVGGVSIGAFMGALWSIHRDINFVSNKSKQWFYNMTRYVGLFDLTYPITSIFSGRYFNWTLKETFDQDILIEDLWLPFYCVSTDITVSRERVHRTGTVWRYCRASMSYAWICPPICDPKDGHLLLDGCYVNNVPASIMLQSNCSHIIAVDVTAMDSSDLTNYGDALSGWWLLWNKFNPFSGRVNIPTQSQIQERLAYCSHYKNLEEIKRNEKYEYIFPPVGHFSSAKFDSFKEIYDVGYNHGNAFFYGLRKGNSKDKKQHERKLWLPTANILKKQKKCTAVRRTSSEDDRHEFTDLASLVVMSKTWQGIPRSRSNTMSSRSRTPTTDNTDVSS